MDFIQLISKAIKSDLQQLFFSSIASTLVPDFQYFSFHLLASKVFHSFLFIDQIFSQKLQLIFAHCYLIHLLVHLLSLHLRPSFMNAFQFCVLILLKMQRYHYLLPATIQFSFDSITYQGLCCFPHLRIVVLIFFENRRSLFILYPISFNFVFILHSTV